MKKEDSKLTPVEMQQTIDKVKDICNENKRGFVFAVTIDEPEKGCIQSNATVKITNVNKFVLLTSILSSLSLDDEDLKKYMLMREISEVKSETVSKKKFSKDA